MEKIYGYETAQGRVFECLNLAHAQSIVRMLPDAKVVRIDWVTKTRTDENCGEYQAECRKVVDL